MNAADRLFASGIAQLEAASALRRAELARAEARVSMLGSVAKLQRAGLEDEARDLLAEIRRLQEQDRLA